jgi:Carboxypeptidase regulatory-like domain/TonB-dependent Receptor Plug Domain
MRRFSLVLALVLALALPAFAQVSGGNIAGTVKDQQGGVLPGVLVTVQGVDATQTFTTDSSGEFRFLDLAPGLYKLTVELPGFKTLVRADLVVAVGKNVELSMTLTVAAVAETVTVLGESPIVDPKATGTATNFTSDELKAIPTSRDPFALMRSVPGVLVDRVNIGGNETGQQSNFASKGTRPQDAVWTLDGVNITDMAATGSAPVYFNFDNFEEIQVSTAGNDIKSSTGGMGLNFVIKRGSNQFHGGVRGYFDNTAMESNNVPDELKALATPVTPATADHIDQISDYGFDVGGPIWKDRAWFYGSYSLQDVRLFRRTTQLIDETKLKNPDVKLNWQATQKDMVSFLYFDGFKIKDGRTVGTSGILFEAPAATWHQDNAYTAFPLHGLWKIADDRVVGQNLFISGKYAYFNTGFSLNPEGGLGVDAGQDFVTEQSFGSTRQSLNLRPQQVVNIDANSFLHAGGSSHDLKYGFGFRTTDIITGTLYPGDGILALENTATDLRAQVFRQGYGGNRANYLDFYVGDVIAMKNNLTIDVGLRFDHQGGEALPSTTAANPAFPTLVPGIVFAGYNSPFTWNNFSPRVGLTYALGESRKTIARVSYSRFAGQLDPTTIGNTNPSSTAGSATYRWVDSSGDHLAQPNEVLLNQFITAGGGFNPANPTAVTSANVTDPNLSAPVTQNIVAGVDRELMPNLAVQVSYSYTRTSNLFGDFAGAITPRVGVTLADYTPGSGFTGTLPDGSAYNVPTFIPIAADVAAGGNGFLRTNIPGYYTDYHGIEIGLVKRLSNRWMSRVGVAWNNAREHFTQPAGIYDTNGNPTPTLSEPLKDGGQFAPQSAGSGEGGIYTNAKWQINANALYQAPYGLEVSGNLFGRQGYPYPMFRQGTSVALGADSGLQVLVTPQIDYFRYPNLWDTDLRLARAFKVQTVSIRLIGDVFNLLNADTALVRNNNVLSTGFQQLAQNLNPRIFRIGVVVGF